MGPGGTFVDDDGNTHEASINSITDDGVTLGCDALGNYCPTDNVRRDQMASFLGRALDLDPIIPPPPTTTTMATTTTTGSGTTTTTTGGGTSQTITLAGITFSPDDVTVSNGAMVTFDNVSGIHDLVWLSGPYPGESPASDGWSVTFTAGTAGTFAYYCNVHGNAGGDGMVTDDPGKGCRRPADGHAGQVQEASAGDHLYIHGDVVIGQPESKLGSRRMGHRTAAERLRNLTRRSSSGPSW